jgi:ribosomal protein S18 acetylase RimI-like enzyme
MSRGCQRSRSKMLRLPGLKDLTAVRRVLRAPGLSARVVDASDVVIREARPADARAIARVHVDTWRTSYAGIIPQAFHESRRNREALWAEVLATSEGGRWTGHFVYVAALHGKDIVGFAHGGPERTGDPAYRGELCTLYVLQAYQRRGLGSRLMAAVVGRFVEDGVRSMLVRVFRDNPARRFYEALGGRVVGVRSTTIRGLHVDEVAYGWTDITPLAPGHEGSDARRLPLT